MSVSGDRPRAIVVGCAGAALTGDERRLFASANPLGFCLFRRNCRDPEQLRRLTGDLRDAVGRDVPILVDQEGGRVQRLKPPNWPRDPAAAAFGALARSDPGTAERAVRLMSAAIAADLAAHGITGNAYPVLDLAFAGTSDVIGDRAYSDDPAVVVRLGRAAAEAMLDGGVMPIVKHLPGHGRSLVDSHQRLPVIDADLATLEALDFVPFQALADMPWGMTSHCLYTAIDADRPATLSPTVIGRVIRGAIGFDGVLISDDLSMGALSGPIAGRATAALDAGCDIALHCNGRLDEMAALLADVGPINDETAARLARAEERRRQAAPADAAALRAEVDALLSAA